MATALAPQSIPAVPSGTFDINATTSAADAQRYDEIIRNYAILVRYGWYTLGDAACVIEDRQLWKEIAQPIGEEPFHSFNDYASRRMGLKSRTAVYRARSLRLGLKAVPESACKEMTQANAIWLLKMVERIGAKKALKDDVIENALHMQEKAFAEFCNANMPGAAKEERKRTISVRDVDESLAKIVEQAFEVAMWDTESEDRRVAMERIVSHYLESKCEHEGLHKLSHLQAFEKATGGKSKRAKEKAS